jgi:hypothetical protein
VVNWVPALNVGTRRVGALLWSSVTFLSGLPSVASSVTCKPRSAKTEERQMGSLTDNAMDRLILAVKDAVIKSTKVESNQAPERDYGYFTIMSRSTGKVLRVVAVGDVPAAMVEPCERISLEKCRRTFETGNVSSWVDRDFDAKEFGGGIELDEEFDVIIAFSGLKEYADETVCIDAAQKTSLISEGKVAAILDVSSACVDYPVTTTEFLKALEAA